MAVSGKYRRERAHQTGKSNRANGWLPAEQTGPIDFDQAARSTAPQLMRYKTDLQIPSNTHTGQGNQDFAEKLPGHYVSMPMGDPQATQQLRKEVNMRQSSMELTKSASLPAKISAPSRSGQDHPREPRVKGHKVAPRWNPDKWFQAPHYTQAPLQKNEGETWNAQESVNIQGEIKGQDRLLRTVRRPEDVATPSDSGGARRHPLDGDSEEYYPGRDSIDAVDDAGGAVDYQIRPINLPDFFNPPPEHGDSVMRMQRIREVLKQRYAGRPRLMGVFKNCALTKPGYVFPRDMQQVFDQMGIKVSSHEAEMLINAVDKDRKGAVTFDEFADLIYGDRVNVGGPAYESQERHVRHVTKNLVDNIVANGSALGKAFCELDPERRYNISKDQFRHALGSACNHVSNQAIEYLWAAQFQGQQGQNVDGRSIDWRGFMSQLSHFAHDHRAPTPCTVQGRKRQYDLLQRSASLTGGFLTDADMQLNRPDQNADDEVRIVADKLVHRHSELPFQPRDATFLTPHYVEEIRTKAERVERTLPQRIPQARLRQLLSNRETVHQDELVRLIADELDRPHDQRPLPKQEPLYGSSRAPAMMGNSQVLTLDARSMGSAMERDLGPVGSSNSLGNTSLGGPPHHPGLALVKGDVQAYVAAQHHNRDHEVNVEKLIKGLYRPPHEKKVLDSVNDGLNRQRRGNRPPRERPAHSEQPRYENYWQARTLMDQVNDAIAEVERSNGGLNKPSKIFKRLDYDNDGYVSLSDLKSACEKYKIPHETADLHAMFSELDRRDKGSVDVGEFTRHFEVFQGSLLDNMQKPMKSVYYDGGVEFAGPVQEKLDARDKAVADGTMPGNLPKAGSSKRGHSRSGSAPATPGSTRSRLNTGASTASASSTQSVIYGSEVARMVNKGRISDVIRSRVNAWKPQKHELFTSQPKTRFGMTIHPDTRIVTEPSVPFSDSYLPDDQRFKTTNTAHSIFSVPDHRDPQTEDAMKKHARNEFRVERIRHRQADFDGRAQAANEAAREHDELKIARKAMNQLNYERRVAMSCA